mmetsp:Transcript_36534/g.91094  ORF Transcript_36534/g.91094 Transcript_36534/m.91094 type:complete len:217 (-) Transcript_36534:930-1580(-)
MAWLPASNAFSHTPGVDASSRSPSFFTAAAAAEKNISYSAPLVPPMLRRMVIPTASSSPAGPPSSGMYATSSRSASAPRACVTPQSPSPTLVSASVSTASASRSAAATAVIAAHAATPAADCGENGPRSEHALRRFLSTSTASTSAWKVPAGGMGAMTAKVRATGGHAGAPTKASNRSSRSWSTLHRVMLRPVMFSADMKTPTYMRTGLSPWSCSQ